MSRRFLLLGLVCLLAAEAGCKHMQVTAVSLSNPCEPAGIPFYLPKPLLIIAKNFRNVEESHVGDMGPVPIPKSFASQSEFADLKANVAVSSGPVVDGGGGGGGGGVPQSDEVPPTPDPEDAAGGSKPETPRLLPNSRVQDGATPDTFYTYQIVFVPDPTQKYALQIKGGAGEMRAAMNLVNGWMFTGLGPYYLKDSSTAQNLMAGGAALTLGGRGVADVINSLANLRGGRPGAEGQAGVLGAGQMLELTHKMRIASDANGGFKPIVLPRHAEIYVYEQVLIDGIAQWQPVANHCFDRVIFGITDETKAVMFGPGAGQSGMLGAPTGPSSQFAPAGQNPPLAPGGASGQQGGVLPPTPGGNPPLQPQGGGLQQQGGPALELPAPLESDVKQVTFDRVRGMLAAAAPAADKHHGLGLFRKHHQRPVVGNELITGVTTTPLQPDLPSNPALTATTPATAAGPLVSRPEARTVVATPRVR